MILPLKIKGISSTVCTHCKPFWINDVSGIKYQMLGAGRVEYGGLGCTHLRLDGFGSSVSLSDLGWDWLALCLCRFGWVGGGWPGGKQPIGPAICRSPALSGCTQERDGNRHHTRLAVISQTDNEPTNQPSSQPQAAGPPTTRPELTVLFL